ncbi:LPS export ABC transporter periplasmic protein LptC [bacterium]|nr:LPS export ABC transporter periplasmic protein LptC [bacterium]
MTIKTLKALRTLFCFIFVAGILSCNPEAENNLSRTDKSPDQESQNTTVNFTNEGRKVAVLWAQHLSKFKDHNLVIGETIKVTFFDSLGNPSTFLTADSGQFEERDQEILVWGNVEVESVDKVFLWTNSLLWDPKLRLIKTDDPVKIKRGSDIIEGVGFVSDINFDNIRITKNISGRISSD